MRLLGGHLSHSLLIHAPPHSMALNMPAEFVFDKIQALDRWQLLFPQDKMTQVLQINQVQPSSAFVPTPQLRNWNPVLFLTRAPQVASIARLVATSDSMFIDDREFSVSARAIPLMQRRSRTCISSSVVVPSANNARHRFGISLICWWGKAPPRSASS